MLLTKTLPRVDSTTLATRTKMTTQMRFLTRAAKIANVVLAGGGVATVLVWLRVLYDHGVTGNRSFGSSTSLVFYCILPAAIASLLFAGLRLKSTYKVILAVLCVSIVTSAYTVELSLPIPEKEAWIEFSLEKQHEILQLAKQDGVEFDVRNPAEVIAGLRQRRIDAVSAVFPRYLLKRQPDESVKSAVSEDGQEVIPLGGITARLTVMCNQSGQYVTYTSDEHGFHNPRGIWQTDRLEIAALGKSFTQGFCVPSERNFIALIRNQYPATLNLGMATHGPLFMLATIKEYLQVFRPKSVLWFYSEGYHVSYLQHEKKSALLARYMTDVYTQGLLGRQSAIDRALTDYVEKEQPHEPVKPPASPNKTPRNEFLKTVKLHDVRQKLGLAYGTDEQELIKRANLEADMKLFHNILSQAKIRVNAWGGNLYFVYLPGWARYGNNARDGDKERTNILALVRSLGIPIIDLVPAFQAHGDPLSLFPFRRFYHYNERGHQLVAEELLRIIRANELSASLQYHG